MPEASPDLADRLRRCLARAVAGQAAAPELEAEGAQLERLRRLLDRLEAEVGDLAAAVDPDVLELPAVPDMVLLNEIGRGGGGVVYRAFQLSAGRLVAVKVLLGGRYADPVASRRFTRELELTARLRHPGVVGVLFGGRVNGQSYFVMEYVAGRPLHQHLREARPARRDILGLFVAIGEAVDAAHRGGVLHRDLKPSNVLVDADGAPHLLDFGMGKALDARAEALTEQGMVMGTLSYLSPEQTRGLPLDARTDVYSLGVMLYEALVGRLPYPDGEDPPSRMRRIAAAEVEPPPSSIGRDTAAVLLRALERVPEARYGDAAGFVADLRRLLEGAPVAARSGRLARLVRRQGRRVLALGLAVACGGALVMAAGSLRERREVRALRQRALDAQEAVELRRRPPGTGWLEVAVARHPDLADTRLVLAQSYLRDPENRELGVRLLEASLARDPARWADRLLLAEAVPGRVGVLVPPDGTAEELYVASLATLDAGSALRWAARAVDRDPSHALAWRRVLRLRQRAGDHAGALEAVDRLLALEGGSCKLYQLRADALVRGGRPEEALADSDRALDEAPDDLEARRQRATILRLLARHQEALAEYDIVISAAPPSRDPWDQYQRAGVLWILGRREDALADYVAVRARLGWPFFGDARRALILVELGRWPESRRVLEDALAASEDAWLREVLRCLLGVRAPAVLVARADPADAERRCEALYYAAEAELAAGRCREARRYLEGAVATGVLVDPDVRALRPMNEMDLALWRLRSLPPE